MDEDTDGDDNKEVMRMNVCNLLKVKDKLAFTRVRSLSDRARRSCSG